MKNWVIATKKCKGELPLIFGHGERVIYVYASQNSQPHPLSLSQLLGFNPH